MAQRGRKPNPTVLKLAHGNPHQHALRKDEPVAPISIPDAPSFLGKFARTVWDRVCKDLHGMRILSAVDVETIAAFCQAAEDQASAIETVNKEGRFIENARGDTVRHPACAAISDASSRIDRHGSVLGLNPSARSRIVAPGGKDSLEEFKRFLKHG